MTTLPYSLNSAADIYCLAYLRDTIAAVICAIAMRGGR